MSDDRKRIRLPGKLTFTTIGIALALAGAGCGDDDSPADGGGRDSSVMDSATADATARDASLPDAPIEDVMNSLFCFADNTIDSGPDFDAAVCPPTVSRVEDCPPGCRAVG